MKWKLLLAFCFSLLLPYTTNAGEPAFRPPATGGYQPPFVKNPNQPTTGKVGTSIQPANEPKFNNLPKAANDPVYDNAKKFSKTKKVVKVGAALKTANHIRKNKWKYAAGAVIAGSLVAIHYKNDIDRIIDKEFYSNKWRSEKKTKLVSTLSKKIQNAKPEKKDDLISAIQQSLIYYMGKYKDDPFDKLASSVLISLNLMTPAVINQVSFERQQRNDARALIKSKIDEVERSRRRTNCQKGSYEREYITSKNPLKTNGSNTLTEWDVGHYGVQVNINNKNNRLVKKYNKTKAPNDPIRENYDFEKDHIPSKKAVALYLANRDNLGVLYNDPKATNIENNAITVVMKTSIHKRGRTNGPDNKIISIQDARNLKQAIFDDFEEYYLIASKDNRNDLQYKSNWSRALVETYIENEKMCLFI